MAEVPFRLTERAARVREQARALLDSHGLRAWEFGFNANVRRAGVCFYPHAGEPGRIELSAHFAANNADAEVLDTLLHEVAHALVGARHGHGAVWRAKCRELGARPEACYGAEVAMPRGRWRAACPACTAEYDRHRRPPRAGGWFCRPCGPDRGRLIWGDAGDCLL